MSAQGLLGVLPHVTGRSTHKRGRTCLFFVLLAGLMAACCAQGQELASRAQGDNAARQHWMAVAVIDTGIDPEVGQAAESFFLPMKDMVSAATTSHLEPASVRPPGDEHCLSSHENTQHGNEVARLIAGVVGSAPARTGQPRVLIQPIRVYNGCDIHRRDLLNALAWAGGLPTEGVAANPFPARIINLSLSSPRDRCGRDLQEVINRLMAQQVFVVAAAGNTFHKSLKEPANCQGVIAVGALDADNQIADYTALDPAIRVYAFGGNGNAKTSSPGARSKQAADSSNISPAAAIDRVQELLDRNKGTSFAAPLITGYLTRWLRSQPDKTLPDFLAELSRFTLSVAPPRECQHCAPRALPLDAVL